MPPSASNNSRRSIISLQEEANILKKVKENEEKRRRLEKEIKDLKNPLTTSFKRNLKKGLLSGGKSTLKFLDEITRPVPVRSVRINKRNVSRSRAKPKMKSKTKRRNERGLFDGFI